MVARTLLLTYGPSGMTLAGVAEKLDRSHSNIIHHFGSAEKLQAAVMSMMVDDLARALAKAMDLLGPGEARARILVDTVFDAFDEGGAAVLAAWIMLANKQPHLLPIREAVSALAHEVDKHLAEHAEGRFGKFPSLLLFLALCAFADSLIGKEFRAILKTDAAAMRDLAVKLVPHFL